MSHFTPTLLKDMYKVFHPFAYNPLMTHVHGNFTNRHGKYSNTGMEHVVFVGLQYFILDTLIENWNTNFFCKPKAQAIHEYSRVVNSALGKEINTKHFEDLHDLGFLPLEIKALPEGSLVPYGVPCLTVTSTVEHFGWCTNMIETCLSAELWGICTSATTAFAYRSRFEAEPSLNKEMIPFMGHDFSYRGMFGTQAAAMSGFGHLCSFLGSDTIPAALFAEKFYRADVDKELVFTSVDATEHSVMCSYGMEGEIESLEHLMNNVTPNGILSVVSDTWDFWKLVTEYLPKLKDQIMSRDGTVVIRPDSGDPVKILTGHTIGKLRNEWGSDDAEVYEIDGTFYKGEVRYNEFGDVLLANRIEVPDYEVKGLIECLWDTFGGTTDENNMRLLDSHIGAIYGDSITLERQDQIIKRLVAKKFVPSVVLGIGSYTYQYVTRDTHGSAMKATDIQMGTGNHMPIFKDPKTDRSKKSAKGLLMVVKEDGVYKLIDNVSPEDEASDRNELRTVFFNGQMKSFTTLSEIRSRINSNF